MDILEEFEKKLAMEEEEDEIEYSKNYETVKVKRKIREENPQELFFD